jgi:hypothetical protein
MSHAFMSCWRTTPLRRKRAAAAATQQLDILEQRPIRKSTETVEEASTDQDPLISEAGEERLEPREPTINAEQPMSIVEAQTKAGQLRIIRGEGGLRQRGGLPGQDAVVMQEEQKLARGRAGTGVALRAASGCCDQDMCCAFGRVSHLGRPKRIRL